MLMTTIVLGATVLVLAIYRKGDVTFNVKWLGANVLLEAKDASKRKEPE